MEVLDLIIWEESNGEFYYDIRNSEGKRWLIGCRNMKTAFEIYQPTASTGKLLKAYFPYFSFLPLPWNKFGIKKNEFVILPELKSALTAIFGDDFSMSFFGGTPSVHQKAVLQIFRGNRILSYCKVTNNPQVAILFDHECENLKYLNRCGISNIPTVQLRSRVGELDVFCQSSVKQKNAKTALVLKQEHIVFLQELYQRTAVSMPFSKTDYGKMLEDLKAKIYRIPAIYQPVIKKTIDLAQKKYQDKKVRFGFYHGDFTPWNMAIEDNNLKIFDFEYAQRSYPPYLDVYHFFLQTEIYVKQQTEVDQVLADFDSCIMLQCFMKENIYWGMLLYLLEVLHLYIARSEKYSIEEEKRQKLRLLLLERMVDKCK